MNLVDMGPLRITKKARDAAAANPADCCSMQSALLRTCRLVC